MFSIMLNKKFILFIFALKILPSLAMINKENYNNDLITDSLNISSINADIDTSVKQAMQNCGTCQPVDIAHLKTLYKLELKSKVADIITAKTGFIKSNGTTSMVMHWLSGALINASCPKEAVNTWLSLQKNLKMPTAEIKPVLLLPESTIIETYKAAQQYKESASTTIIIDLISRISNSYGHEWNDTYEAKQVAHPSRSLQALKQNGLKIQFAPEKISLLQKVYNENQNCSMLEKLKNDRFLTINGFKNSKIALMIHDAFDHFWTYSLLEKHGLLAYYTNFLQKVGNPHITDIFKREGELIASIAYEYRYTTLSDKTDSLLTYRQIKELLNQSGLQTANQQRAYDLLNKHESNPEFTYQLPMITSNVFVELMEQRRKHGFIRVFDKNFNSIGTLSTLDPEYLALITDTYNCLYTNKHEGINALSNIMIMGENYLVDVAKNNQTNNLIIKLSDIENYDITNTLLSSQQINQIKQNLGSVSSRRVIC